MNILHVTAVIVAIILCGVLDRIRGGWRPLSWMNWEFDAEAGFFGEEPIYLNPTELAAKFGYGALLACLMGMPGWSWAVVSIAWWFGEKPGWGHPVGQALFGVEAHAKAYPDDKPEWWQIGWLNNFPWVALAIRGAMWGAPALVIAWWVGRIALLPLFAAIAMPAGEYIELRLYGRDAAFPRTFNGEWWRGIILGMLCAAL